MKVKVKFRVEFVSIWLLAFVITTIVFVVGYSVLTSVKIDELPDDEVFMQALNKSPAPESEQEDVNTETAMSTAPTTSTNDGVGEVAEIMVSTGRLINEDMSWSYRGEHGPELWGRLSQEYRACSQGEKQSPVDLTKVTVKEELSPIKLLYKEFVDGEFSIVGRNLIFKTDPGSVAILFDESYYLSYVTFHAPSEHRLKSIPYDMEIQFVHENSQGKIAVIALLANEKSTPNKILNQLWKQFPAKNGAIKYIKNLDLGSIFPKNIDYFNYEGSMTTPPCVEGVQWFVLEKAITVSGDQVERLLQSMRFNSRPLQRIHDRVVYKNPR